LPIASSPSIHSDSHLYYFCSHAFIPYDADDHTGVVFPTGLQLLRNSSASGTPPSLLLSYGKGDDRVMMMTLGYKAVQEYLQPVDSWKPERYRFCTAGMGIPVNKVV
jgi:hypothetical protein